MRGYCKPGVRFTFSNGTEDGFVALNSKPLLNKMLWAVVAVNEPEISKLAPLPKIIPLGLSKNKLALPNTPNLPKMFDGFFPVTRVRIFSIAVWIAKINAFTAINIEFFKTMK